MAIVRRTRSTRGLVILLITISLVTITIDYRQGSSGPMAKLSDGVQSVIIPMQDGVSKVFHPIGAFLSALVHLPSNANRIRDLEDKNHAMEQEHVRYLSVLKLLQDLQGLLDVTKSFDFDTEFANVVANSVSNFEWSITINKGSKAGVKKDMPVMSSQGLVGRVSVVTAFGSKVLLILDFTSNIASLVDQSTEVTVGEPVETSAYNGGLFPAGIPIGTVSSVSIDPATGEKDIEVKPLVDFSKLDVVAVVTSFGGS